MGSQHHASGLVTASGWHHDPVTHHEIVTVRSEIVDAPGIPEANTDHTLGRGGLVEPENGFTFATAALADLLTRLEAALESLTRALTRLIDRRRRRPGSV
jgi:hypothetical protein